MAKKVNKSGVKINSAAGFSLVELMVVVAIIGILASVAVPQFQRFTYKARLTEAKTGLSSLYTAEKAFFSEWSQYDNRFQIIGYAPEGTYSTNIGFNSTGGTTALSTNWANTPNNTPPDTPFRQTYSACPVAAGAGACRSMASAKATIPNTSIVVNSTDEGVASTFIAEARALPSLHPDGITTSITIDQNKNLVQISGAL